MGRTKQYADRVNIIKQVKVKGRWPFAPVVEKNGKIIRDHVWVSGEDEHHPEGRYYIEWYQEGKRARQSVGQFEAALDAARRKSIELNAAKAGLIELKQTAEGASRTLIGKAIDEYLEFVKAHRKFRTHLSYRFTLDTLLRQSYTKTYVDEVSREDLIKFMTDCYKRGLSKRTVYDKLVTVLQMFKRHGKVRLIESSDWPEYVEAIRPIYEAEELQAMFKAATEDEAILVKFLVASGLRDQEIRYLQWRDVDLRNSLVRVTAKGRWGFTPKNWEERSVPLPGGLIEHLCKLKAKREAGPIQLVFPNTRGNPDSYMDMIIKRLVRRAGLNCGQCITEHGNKCSEGPYCMNFYLHKFRHTFATEHLRHGVDIRTLQGWMGHRDIKSTMVYLKGVNSKDALIKVNAGSIAEYAS